MTAARAESTPAADPASGAEHLKWAHHWEDRDALCAQVRHPCGPRAQAGGHRERSPSGRCGGEGEGPGSRRCWERRQQLPRCLLSAPFVQGAAVGVIAPLHQRDTAELPEHVSMGSCLASALRPRSYNSTTGNGDARQEVAAAQWPGARGCAQSQGTWG